MKSIGQLETTHQIFQPPKKAKKCTPPRSQQAPTPYLKNQADREAWMRAKQAKKKQRGISNYELRQVVDALKPMPNAENQRMAVIERKREAQLLAEAESELRRKRKSEKEEPDFTDSK